MPEVLHSYGVRIFNIDRKTGVVLDTPFFLHEKLPGSFRKKQNLHSRAAVCTPGVTRYISDLTKLTP